MARQAQYPWFVESKWLAVRPLIFERDGYACVNCGDVGTNDKTNPLTVDHIKPLDLFNDDDINDGLAYDPDNLVTLCNSCNGRKQNKVNLRQNWINSKWFVKR